MDRCYLIVDNAVNMLSSIEEGGMPLGRSGGRHAAGELADRATAYLVTHGAPRETARIQAAHLVEAELRGHPSHGLRRLAILGARIEAGFLDPAAQPQVEWTSAAGLRVDGRRGFGPVSAYAAIDALLDRLPETGVAVASLYHTHHLGMLAPYSEALAERGVISLVLSSTEALVHPWGGAGALVGTNPIGIGVGAQGGDLVLDMSTGAVSAGKILDYRARGLPLPPGWAVDASGEPTTDPSAAVEGAISPFGGAKGYALGIALGAVVGALTGTALGPDVRGTLDAETETTKGDIIVAFDPTGLCGADARERVGAYLSMVRNSGPQGRRVWVPGDRARSAREQSLEEGVTVQPDVWELLEPVAAEPRRESGR